MKTPRKGVRVAAFFAIATLMVVLGTAWRAKHRLVSPASSNAEAKHLFQLLGSTGNAMSRSDIAEINLLCAEDLGGLSAGVLNAYFATLDAWSKRIASETTRHWYRFRKNPQEFNHSEGYFRMLMMAVVLAEDFHIQYDPTLRMAASSSSSDDRFFASADSVFLSGLLGSARKGTCSSLPVLYVALGRRLGYPLHLVTTKGHLFVRWDGQGERFNIEATSHGLNTFADDYYRQWPWPITAEEESAEGYLKNLDAAGELAVFLSIRAMCLRDNGRIKEAAEAFGHASRFAPHCRTYAIMYAELSREAHSQETSAVALLSRKGTSP